MYLRKQSSGAPFSLNVFVSVNFEINFKKNRLYNEHYPSILVTFLGRPSILVGKMEHEGGAF